MLFKAPGNKTNVILGGGRPAFLPGPLYEELYKSGKGHKAGQRSLLWNNGANFWNCRRQDGLNLVQDWLDSKGSKARFVDNLESLNHVNADDTDYLFGLFAEYHVAFDDERDPTYDPSLNDMTAKAIEVSNVKCLVQLSCQ